MRRNDSRSVAIQFSGGSDSSLTAYRMASVFDKVHLLTFKHFGQIDIENSRKSYTVLAQKVPDKFVHHIIHVDEMFEKIYYRHYVRNIFTYRTLQLQFTCFACQACFHIHTILFCLRNNIFEVRDGSNSEYDATSPMQIKIVQNEIKKLYTDYGIHHDSPVYDEHQKERSDHQLYKLGLRPRQNIKDDLQMYQAYQGYCRFMPGGVLFLNYWKRRHDFPQKVQQQIYQHWLEEMDFFKRLIDEYVLKS